MKIILGIDVGGSTTKIVACDQNLNLLNTLQVQANDQLTSLYGAIGHFLQKYDYTLSDISQIVLTGVGATLIQKDIYQIPTAKVNEFEAIGFGGLKLANLDEALVVSMGTGTAYVKATKNSVTHIGGSGVGGGTLLGLSNRLFHETNVETITQLAQKGNLNNVDLTIKDISNIKIPTLPQDTTASNFGKYKESANKEDLATGLINMVYQTIGMLASFALVDSENKTAILTGTLTTLPQAKPIFNALSAFQNIKFITPPNAVFATAIGAVITYYKK